MSIDDIKDINKLRNMLKEAYKEIIYLKGCCRKAGEELANYTFEYDEKPKNLVVQAMDLVVQAIDINDKYKKLQNQNKNILFLAILSILPATSSENELIQNIKCLCERVLKDNDIKEIEELYELIKGNINEID